MSKETRTVVIDGEEYSYSVDLDDIESSMNGAHLREEISTIQFELNETRAALNRSNKSLSAALAENDQLKSENDQLKSENGHLRVEIDELKMERENTGVVLEHEKVEKERYCNELHDCRNENSALKEKISAIENQPICESLNASSVVLSPSMNPTLMLVDANQLDTQSSVPEPAQPSTSQAVPTPVVPLEANRKRQPKNSRASKTFIRDVTYAAKNRTKKNFTCDLCTKSFMKLSLLKFHMKRTHQITDRKNEFGCVDCGSVFGNRKILRDHRLASHSDGN